MVTLRLQPSLHSQQRLAITHYKKQASLYKTLYNLREVIENTIDVYTKLNFYQPVYVEHYVSAKAVAEKFNKVLRRIINGQLSIEKAFQFVDELSEWLHSNMDMLNA